jgi:hypothetical protein
MLNYPDDGFVILLFWQRGCMMAKANMAVFTACKAYKKKPVSIGNRQLKHPQLLT